MKTLLSILCLILASAAMNDVAGQEPDSTKAYPKKKVNSKDDPLRWNTRRNKLNSMVKIDSVSAPQALLATLKSSDKYKGWQKGMIYKTKEDDMYVVKITDGKKEKEFKFAHNGNPIK